jgi:hypothetical protein
MAVNFHTPFGDCTGAVQRHAALPGRRLGSVFEKRAALICSVHLVVAGADAATLSKSTGPAFASALTRRLTLKGSIGGLARAAPAARGVGVSAKHASNVASSAASSPIRLVMAMIISYTARRSGTCMSRHLA